MIQLDFTTNPNGKLFQDVFIDIRMASQAYTEGAPVKIVYKGIELGEARIEEVTAFNCGTLSNVTSFLNCGRSAAYQRTLISRYYNKGYPADYLLLNILVLRWDRRDMQAQSALIQQWWDEKKYSTL